MVKHYTMFDTIQRYHVLLTLLIFISAGAFIRLYGLGAWDYYHDEMWHVYVARQPTIADVFYTNLIVDGHPVLPYFLWHWLLDIWNDPWMARLPSLVSGILVIPMGYVLGKEMLGTKNAGLVMAFFLAFGGVTIPQSDVVRGYMVMLLAGMVALWSVCRYQRQPHLGFMLLYFLSMGIAFLSEYSIVTLAVFTGLYLLYGIYKQPSGRIVALVLYGIIHIALLAYLFSFKHLLHTIGALNFDDSAYFFNHYDPMPKRVLKTFGYFLTFINESNITPFIAAISESEWVAVVCLFVFFLTCIAGVVWLCKYRKWALLSYVALSSVMVVGLDSFGILPMHFPRHHIEFVLPVIVLFYAGFCYFLHDGLKRKVQSSSLPLIAVLLTLSVFLSAAYALHAHEWRMIASKEFQQTRKQTSDIFAYLGDHTQPQDAMVTDWLSYLFFWRNDETCPLTPLTQEISLYDCYRVPVFVLRTDFRNAPFALYPASVQRALRHLENQKRLDNIKRIWFVGIQSVNVKTHILNPFYPTQFKGLVPESQKITFKKQIDQLLDEQATFANYIYETTEVMKTTNAYPCSRDGKRPHIDEEEDNDCLMSLLLIAVPKNVVDEKIIHHTTFMDTMELLHQIQDDIRREKQSRKNY